MTVWICDDEIEIVRQVELIIKSKINAYTFGFCDSETALNSLNDDTHVDVLIIDIILIDENGIDIAAVLQRRFPDMKVIFISGYSQYTQDIFLKVKPFGFLSKPINADILIHHLKDIASLRKRTEQKYTFTYKKTELKLTPKEIRYIESRRTQLIIYTATETYTIYAKLDDEEKRLTKQFIRCHKSFLVNVDYIKQMKDNHFYLFTGEKIPISRARTDIAREQYFKIKGGL